MKLSLPEAATILGKSPRQVRYMIKSGQLPATKEGGRWRIDSAGLPLTEAQRAALAARFSAAVEAFEEGLEPIAKVTEPEPSGTAASRPEGEKARKGKKTQSPYSVMDLIAFQVGQEIYRDLRDALEDGDAAIGHLFHGLTLLTRGCHSYHPDDKAKRFAEAREHAAMAVTELLLHGGGGPRQELARRIEHELISKIASLVASQEKRSRRHRFDRFGSAVRPR